MPTKTTQPSDNLTNPYGYSERDWAVQLDPAYAAARAEVRRLSVGEDGMLPVKVKALMRHEGGVVRGHQSRGRGSGPLQALDQAGVFTPPTTSPAVRGWWGTATTPPPPAACRQGTPATREG